MTNVPRTLRLSEAPLGKRLEVVRVEGSGLVKRRMMDLGLLPGTIIKVVGKAPLGDPLDVEVKGFNLSIRRREAFNIVVRVVE